MTNKVKSRAFVGACLALATMSLALAEQTSALAPAPTAVVAPVAQSVDINAAMAAYNEGRYQQAADTMKPIETTNGRAAGVVCELFVRKLLPPEDERGSAACNAAVKVKDPNGLVWRGLAGREGHPTLNMPVTEAATLGYYALAAELDYPPAFGRLCEYYYKKKSFQQALPFCKYAGGSGVQNALYYYALMAIEGQGVVQDYKKGMDALLLSAQLRFAPALIKLSELSRDGSAGVPKNPVKAYSWILLASSVEPDSQIITSAKQSLAKELGEGKIAFAQNNAASWTMLPQPMAKDHYPSK